MKWIALLLSLSLLVFTHEMGHLGFAKLFHTRVRRFYLFFNWGFSLFKAKKFNGKWHFLFLSSKTPDEWDEKNLSPEDQDNTLWGIGWVPLGGYCDIAGMIDETKGTDDLESTPQPWEYRTKPAWQRLCIISGGVLVNFVSALLLYGLIFAHWGKDELPLRSASLGYQYAEVLHQQGFVDGDIIYAIDGKEYYEISDVNKDLLLNNPNIVTVRRDTSLVDIHLSGNLAQQLNESGEKQLMAIRMPFVIKDLTADSHAKRAGMMPGDSIVSVNGIHMPAYQDLTATFAENKGKELTIGFFRNGTFDSLPVTIDDNGRIGVQVETHIAKLFKDFHHIDYTLWQAIPVGISHGWKTLATYVSSLKLLFAPGGTKNLGGFGAMASLFPSSWDWQAFWELTALLALILAFMNVIPIPGLDGGHILFTLWEIVTGRKPSEKFLSVAQNIGMILLLALMVLANGNDLWRWLSGKF